MKSTKAHHVGSVRQLSGWRNKKQSYLGRYRHYAAVASEAPFTGLKHKTAGSIAKDKDVFVYAGEASVPWVRLGRLFRNTLRG